MTATSAERRARQRQATEDNGGVAPTAAHNASTYTNWGCRCAACRRDSSDAARWRREQRKAKR